MYHLLKLLIAFILVSTPVFSSAKQKYFFNKAPFVHPTIIEDLSRWVSDKGDQVISINLDDSNKSNRYNRSFKIESADKENDYMPEARENPYISITRENACKPNSYQRSPYFGYEMIGKINGVYVLHTAEASCGTGVWNSLIFLKLTTNIGLTYLKEEGKLKYTNKRNIVLKLFELPIGDRYRGHIKIKGNKIYITNDKRISKIIVKDTVIELK